MRTKRISVAQLNRIERKIDHVLRYLGYLVVEGIKVTQELDDLTAEVTRNSEVDASAIALIQGIAARLEAAGTDPVKLKALKESLSASSTALAEAVVANTPAAPTE